MSTVGNLGRNANTEKDNEGVAAAVAVAVAVSQRAVSISTRDSRLDAAASTVNK